MLRFIHYYINLFVFWAFMYLRDFFSITKIPKFTPREVKIAPRAVRFKKNNRRGWGKRYF